MNQKAKAGIAAIVFIGLLVLAWKLDKDYLWLGGAVGGTGREVNYCPPLSFNLAADGSYIVPEGLTCDSGAWVNSTKPAGTIDVYCSAYFQLTKITYTDTKPIIEKIEAKGDEFCQDGKIVTSPRDCGNYKCDLDETDENCWVDCGIIQSWSKMKEESQKPELQTYLEPESAFNYNLPQVEALAKEVEAMNPESPFMAVKYLTNLISAKVSYVPGGVAGNAQCGENSATILDRGYGNCVDYSVVLVATLRRGFDIDGVGRVKIPTRQVAGCLNGYGTWKAIPYLIYDDKAGLYGSVLGHAWGEIYVGNDRWVLADPTTGTSLAKTWYGYYKIADVSGNQMCFVPVESRPFCETFSETG